MEKINNIKTILDELKCNKWKNWDPSATGHGPNFSEAFFGYLFQLNGLYVEREYLVDHYPLDYAVPKAKLAIEIDSPGYRKRGGKKSKKKVAERKEAHLKERGWVVHRINWWRDPFTCNRKHTQEEIDKVLDLLERMDAVR
jgi:very-short-patch-repair endonuclease